MKWTETFVTKEEINSLFNNFTGTKEECERKVYFILNKNGKVADEFGYEELSDAHNALANLIEHRRGKGPHTIRTFVVPKTIRGKFYQVAMYHIQTNKNDIQYLEFSGYSNVLIGKDMVSKYIKEKTEEHKNRVVCRTKEIKIWEYAGEIKFCK